MHCLANLFWLSPSVCRYMCPDGPQLKAFPTNTSSPPLFGQVPRISALTQSLILRTRISPSNWNYSNITTLLQIQRCYLSLILLIPLPTSFLLHYLFCNLNIKLIRESSDSIKINLLPVLRSERDFLKQNWDCAYKYYLFPTLPLNIIILL